MNPIKEDMTLYRCSKCNKYYRNEEAASKCCPQKHCEDCGVLIEDKSYYIVCNECREKKALRKMCKNDLC